LVIVVDSISSQLPITPLPISVGVADCEHEKDGAEEEGEGSELDDVEGAAEPGALVGAQG